MAKTKSYTVKFRRKRSKRTDYKARLKLLVSRKNRLVIRKSLNQTYAQIITYDKIGDKVLVSVNSNKLKKYGWKYNFNNLSACYLVGLLAGLMAKKKKITEAILDIGLRSSVKGSTTYAALKGAIESGLNVNYNKNILPNDDRVRGKHIVNYALHLKKDPENYRKQFSKYLKNNSNPEDITKNFEEVKQKILSEYKNG